METLHDLPKNITFANTQKFANVDAQSYRQVTEQTAHLDGSSTSTGKGPAQTQLQQSFDYSLTTDVLRRSNADGSSTRTVHLQQSFEKQLTQQPHGQPVYRASIRNAREATDESTTDLAHKSVTNSSGQISTQTFDFTDSTGIATRPKCRRRTTRYRPTHRSRAASSNQSSGLSIRTAHQTALAGARTQTASH